MNVERGQSQPDGERFLAWVGRHRVAPRAHAGLIELVLPSCPDAIRSQLRRVVEDNRRRMLLLGGELVRLVRARVLGEFLHVHGKSTEIRSDNGPEFVAAATQQWATVQGSTGRSSNPEENAYIERSNGTFRTEVLDQHAFTDREKAQRIADEWLATYNEQRPYQALGYLPPTGVPDEVAG